MALCWSHLIRFEHGGSVYYGDAAFGPGQQPDQITDLAKSGALEARVIHGDPLSLEAVLTDERIHVDKLLCPLTEDQVPIIRCVGLNYMKHSMTPNLMIAVFRFTYKICPVQEGGRTPPPYPSLFVKPSTALAPFDADIPIPRVAQSTLDYEGELVRYRWKSSLTLQRHFAYNMRGAVRP